MVFAIAITAAEWCERLAERIYEMSVDTFSQSVMPSLHAAGWQRRHLDWEFKLQDKQSDPEAEPDRTLMDGMNQRHRKLPAQQRRATADRRRNPDHAPRQENGHVGASGRSAHQCGWRRSATGSNRCRSRINGSRALALQPQRIPLIQGLDPG